MSELVTLTTGESETIYGTYAEAVSYIGMLRYAEPYKSWIALDVDDRKSTLAGARRFIDRYIWDADYDTFAERDDVVTDDSVKAFQVASYELAALAVSDDSVFSNHELGSNIASVSAGGAGVTYFNPSSSEDGSAPALPGVVQKLLGAYLASSGASISGGFGQEGGEESSFSSCSSYRRNGPY